MSLRRELDHYTGGALSAMNQACRQEGLTGYITVSGSGGTQVFVFTAYQGEQTRYFQSVEVTGAEVLAESVRTSEQLRQLRKEKAGFLLNPAPPAPICWS
jgi:hypothetical protein